MQYSTFQKQSLEKLPPFNLDAERAILGAILLDNSALFSALDIFQPSDFYREAHQKIFYAMMQVNARGEAIDLIVLRDELERSKLLDDIGGPAYLVTLVDIVPTAANIAYHAKIVHEKARLRRVQNACLSIAYKIYDDSNATSHEFLTTLAEELDALRTDAETPWAITSNGKPVAIMQREYIRYIERLGFRATIFNRSLIFAKIERGRLIKEVEWVKNLCYSLKRALRDVYEQEHPLLWELLLKEHRFDYHVMTSLQAVQQSEFITDDATHCHLFFQNGCVTITPETVTFTPYEELQGYVWEKAVSPKEYHGYASGSPAYDLAEELKTKRISEFERFISHVANEYVDGHYVNNQEVFEHGLASLCWHYNDVLQQKAVVVIDNDPSYFADGRRGKKILLDALRYIRSNGSTEGVVIKEDGKAFGGQFKFQRVQANTKVLIVDDVDDETVNIKDFYSAITDGLVSEGKGMLRFGFTPETSPKMVFTTNRPFFGMDRSSTDRLLILPMTDFFTREHQKPAHVFGHRLFYDWDTAEWARFQDYMICIIQEAMRRDPLHLPEPDLSIFNANRILMEMPDMLVAFFDRLKDDTDYEKSTLLEDLRDAGFEMKKQGEFKQTLEKYCRLRGRVLHKNTKDGRYKKNNIEYIRLVRTLWTESPLVQKKNEASDCWEQPTA